MPLAHAIDEPLIPERHLPAPCKVPLSRSRIRSRRIDAHVEPSDEQPFSHLAPRPDNMRSWTMTTTLERPEALLENKSMTIARLI
ncbi:hypothetical protein TWF718_008018 [Orbilia javanica]|uniref:Uncharacterized protein n=1 Tax=Orbilia javanica TaxID=47235 RepID=A0AAN8NTI3_9PEZI